VGGFEYWLFIALFYSFVIIDEGRVLILKWKELSPEFYGE
jgi:hypothetical protein